MAFPTARPIALQTFWQLWPRRAVQQVHQQNQIISDPFRSLQTLRFRSVMEVDLVRFLPGFSDNKSIKVLMMLHLCWKFEKHETPTGLEFHQRLERTRLPRPTAQYWKPSCRMGNIQVQHAANRSKGVHTTLQRSQLAAKAWQTTGLTASWRAGASKHTAVPKRLTNSWL